ncbi:hypothetical protein [Streptomyces virginiae]|uniref:hypothetical protein n=1 Tax=Streptomyces virginiae TaxID=1961 RepID=UPI00324F6CCB
MSPRQYTYDATGNTTKRAETPGSATSQTLNWGPEGKLTKITEGATATDYVYDADGELLIRRDPPGETVLYAGSNEVHLKGAKKWAVRSYSIAAVKIGVLTNESGTAKLSFVAADAHGTSSQRLQLREQQPAHLQRPDGPRELRQLRLLRWRRLDQRRVHRRRGR